MLVDGKAYRSIWLAADGKTVEIIDQTLLPFQFQVARLASLGDAARAIRDMQVRGAPLIGATAAYGVWLGLLQGTTDAHLRQIADELVACRPTAVNLRWAVERLDCAAFAPGLKITISGGVAERTGLAHHERLVSRADVLLYEAKRAGRNRIHG